MGYAIIGAGLAGCEAALCLASAGEDVTLYEMRPEVSTPAHKTSMPAELVCSNSLRSDLVHNAPGLLKEELRRAGCHLIRAADACRIPAGGALAVDRKLFSKAVMAVLGGMEAISLVRGEITSIPSGKVIIAAGPLTSPALSSEISRLTGDSFLYFYDAIAPVVSLESLDMSKVFLQSRYRTDEAGDYLNCPMNMEEYTRFVEELINAERVKPRSFEKEIHFQGCMPVEAIADSGPMSLAHGPMKPVGLVDERTGKRPFAVVQLRMENRSGTAWNLVGFQTKLTQREQRRVFRMIPGLENAEFLRLGSMHRNTFVNGPAVLDSRLRLRCCPGVMMAGQITGVEGYIESIASGFVCAVMALGGEVPPAETAIGALLRHVTDGDPAGFQPANIHYGLFPPLEPGRRMRGRRARREAYSERALAALERWLSV